MRLSIFSDTLQYLTRQNLNAYNVPIPFCGRTQRNLTRQVDRSDPVATYLLTYLIAQLKWDNETVSVFTATGKHLLAIKSSSDGMPALPFFCLQNSPAKVANSGVLLTRTRLHRVVMQKKPKDYLLNVFCWYLLHCTGWTQIISHFQIINKRIKVYYSQPIKLNVFLKLKYHSIIIIGRY